MHAQPSQARTEGLFEVITGKVLREEGDPKYFAFVPHYDTKPKRRLFEILKSRGLQMNQHVEFLTDGGDTVRELPLYLVPESEHWLDWFHITMRLTVMGQVTRDWRQSRTRPQSWPTRTITGRIRPRWTSNWRV